MQNIYSNRIKEPVNPVTSMNLNKAVIEPKKSSSNASKKPPMNSTSNPWTTSIS